MNLEIRCIHTHIYINLYFPSRCSCHFAFVDDVQAAGAACPPHTYSGHGKHGERMADHTTRFGAGIRKGNEGYYLHCYLAVQLLIDFVF